MASEEEERILRLLPKLLRENPDFRRQVAQLLSENTATKDDVQAVLAHLDRLHEDFNRKVEEDNRRFEAIMDEIKALREQLNQEIASLNQQMGAMRSEFNQQMADLRRDMSEQMGAMRSEFNRRLGGVEETLGSFLESYSVRRAVEELEKRLGSAPYKVRRNMSFEGTEIDAVITTDGEVYLMEVSGVVRAKDVRKIRRLADRVQRTGLYPGKQVKPMVAGSRFDKNAEKEAEKLQVEVLYV